MNPSSGKRLILLLIFTLSVFSLTVSAQDKSGMVSGKILSIDGEPVDFATVFLKEGVAELL